MDFARWSADERAFVLENFKKMSYRQIAKRLGRGEAATAAMALKLGLIKKYWTPEEENFLRDNYHRGLNWCAERLGRSRFAVCIRGKSIGLQINKRWSKADVARIYSLHAKGLSNAEISESVGCGPQVVRGYLILRGLASNPVNKRRAYEKIRRTTLARHGALGGTLRKRQTVRARRAVVAVQLDSLGKALEAACQSN